MDGLKPFTRKKHANRLFAKLISLENVRSDSKKYILELTRS